MRIDVPSEPFVHKSKGDDSISFDPLSPNLIHKSLRWSPLMNLSFIGWDAKNTRCKRYVKSVWGTGKCRVRDSVQNYQGRPSVTSTQSPSTVSGVPLRLHHDSVCKSKGRVRKPEEGVGVTKSVSSHSGPRCLQSTQRTEGPDRSHLRMSMFWLLTKKHRGYLCAASSHPHPQHLPFLRRHRSPVRMDRVPGTGPRS